MTSALETATLYVTKGEVGRKQEAALAPIHEHESLQGIMPVVS
jgi:hypothetical protein